MTDQGWIQIGYYLELKSEDKKPEILSSDSAAESTSKNLHPTSLDFEGYSKPNLPNYLNGPNSEILHVDRFKTEIPMKTDFFDDSDSSDSEHYQKEDNFFGNQNSKFLENDQNEESSSLFSYRFREMKPKKEFFPAADIFKMRERSKISNTQCRFCGKKFHSRFTLYRHKKYEHKDLAHKSIHKYVRCAECYEFFVSQIDLCKHLTQEHKIEAHIQRLKFRTFNDYQNWRRRVEDVGCFKFAYERGKFKAENEEVEYFRCHRTGYLDLGAAGRRKASGFGGHKFSFRCSAFARVYHSLVTDECHVIACLTHYGHEEWTNEERKKRARGCPLLGGAKIASWTSKLQSSSGNSQQKQNVVKPAEIRPTENSVGFDYNHHLGGVDFDSAVENFELGPSLNQAITSEIVHVGGFEEISTTGDRPNSEANISGSSVHHQEFDIGLKQEDISDSRLSLEQLSPDNFEYRCFPQKIDRLRKSPKDLALLCTFCDKMCRSRFQLYRHKKYDHPEFAAQSIHKHVKCGQCNENFLSQTDLCQHLQEKHEISAIIRELDFRTLDEYKDWRSHVERDGSFRFVHERGNSKTEKEVIQYFRCHRSGYFESEATGIRKPKALGSKKINFHCSAFAKVCHSLTSGQVHVTTCLTHYGHDDMLKRVPLAAETKQTIAHMFIQEDGNVKRILHALRSDILYSEDGIELNRSNLITRNDIYNVMAKYGLKSQQSVSLGGTRRRGREKSPSEDLQLSPVTPQPPENADMPATQDELLSAAAAILDRIKKSRISDPTVAEQILQKAKEMELLADLSDPGAQPDGESRPNEPESDPQEADSSLNSARNTSRGAIKEALDRVLEPKRSKRRRPVDFE